MPINLKLSSSPSGTRNLAIGSGQGGGVALLSANLFSPAYSQAASTRTLDRPSSSTADYYHIDGALWLKPYDLNAMGTWGQAIAASHGYRYVWFMCADHPSGVYGWGRDPQFVYRAFSNDPAILPDPSTMKPVVSGGDNGYLVPGTGGGTNYNTTMFPWFVYNPDDASNKGYLYVQAYDVNGGVTPNPSWSTTLFSSSDLNTFTVVGLSHLATGPNGFVANQVVYRNGTGSWTGFGGGDQNGGVSQATLAKWTSTDGQSFTLGSSYNVTTSSRVFDAGIGGPYTTIAGQSYAICREDARSADGGQYVSQVPVNSSTGAIITSGTPPIVRISGKYDGVYPGPTYLQSASGYEEDGVYLTLASHGYFSDTGLVAGASYANGGGLDEQYLDMYYVISDATAAANAAPMGVRATCASGTVTLSWYDVPAGRTYRIYRGTTSATQATLIGDVTANSITDTPTVGSVYYYKVVALAGGVEQQSRIVSTYVSSSEDFVNRHITRALDAGCGISTIDRPWMDTVAAFITADDDLLHWVDPAFGVVKDGSNIISRVMDIGTTRLPRGGDYTPSTTASTYSSTQFNSSTIPGVVNANSTSFGYFGGYGRGTSVQGRVNQIRRKPGVTLISAYKKANANLTTLLSIGEQRGMALQNTAGMPGSASFKVYGLAWNSTSTLAMSGTPGSRILAGTFDGTTATVYEEGVAGNAATGAQSTEMMDGYKGEVQAWFLCSGSENSKFTQTANAPGGTYGFNNNQAQKTDAAMIVLGTAASASRIAAFTTLLRSRLGA